MLMVLDVESYPNMPRNRSKAVPKGNSPAPQQDEFGSNQLTLADVYRLFEERFDRQLKIMDELVEEMRGTEQRSASLDQVAWRPHLAMEVDVSADKKTRGCTEGAAAAV